MLCNNEGAEKRFSDLYGAFNDLERDAFVELWPSLEGMDRAPLRSLDRFDVYTACVLVR